MPRCTVLDANDERALAVLHEHAQWPRLERVAVLDRVVARLAHGEEGVVALPVCETPQLEPGAQAPADRNHAGGSLGTSMSMRCGTSSSRTIRSAMSSCEPICGATSSKM